MTQVQAASRVGPVRAILPDAVLRPVREGNAFESTVEHLAMAVRLGVFATGERLPPERELAERLGVGRATLREAIGALRQAGLVTTRRGRGGGTVVVPPGPDRPVLLVPAQRSPAQVADLLLFRRAVEPGAAEHAAMAPLSGEQRAWLVETLRTVTAADNDGERRVADARLHLGLATLTGSALLVDAVAQAQSGLADLLAAIPVLAHNIAHSHAQHAAVVDAVLAGDPVRARTVMAEHCDATSALLRGLLD